jgi:hypothetical protein
MNEGSGHEFSSHCPVSFFEELKTTTTLGLLHDSQARYLLSINHCSLTKIPVWIDEVGSVICG